MTKFILAIDQGTTSTRAILFDINYRVCAIAQQEFAQHFPQSGWVEHDVDDIWRSVIETCHKAILKANASASDIVAIGIANQRETSVIWDRKSGDPIHNAIVWQDRRTSSICDRLKANGLEPFITDRTGLLLDPYFSGTKVAWILDHVEGARTKAETGGLAFGTIDSFLLWRLTGGQVHATDATNASRTMLYNIKDGAWDAELLKALNVPQAVLPKVCDCTAEFGFTDPSLFGAKIPILGIAGDQHAATIGQACFNSGMMKSTYGTGCFMMLNTGPALVRSNNRILTTIAYQLDGQTTYALEGSIFNAGTAVQWLRDGLGIINDATETSPMANAANINQNVYMVPAFTGLGAPYWDAEARGAIFGLTRNTGPNELARAALEAVCYQTRDLLEAMEADWTENLASKTVLRVDGGMVASNWTMQFLSDILEVPVDRPKNLETTALGAAYLAGMETGFYPEPKLFSKAWKLDRKFEPNMPTRVRDLKYAGWKDAVRRSLSNL